MKKLFLILISIITFYSCKNIGNNGNVIGDFDISKDDGRIVLSCYRNNSSSIYTLNNGITKEIVPSTNEINFFYPRYSNDSSKIVFFGFKKNQIESCGLYIANSNGSDIIKIIDDSTHITEPFFSAYGEKIIYIKAYSYGKYSPLGKEQAHGCDIYSYDLSSKKNRQITTINAYGICGVLEMDSNRFIMQIVGGEDGGMYEYSDTSTQKLKRIVPKNNPRESDLYYSPIFSKKYNLLGFTAPYQAYVMNLKDQVAQIAFNNVGVSNIDVIRFYNTQKKILLSFDGKLKSVNIDTHEVVDIPLNW